MTGRKRDGKVASCCSRKKKVSIPAQDSPAKEASGTMKTPCPESRQPGIRGRVTLDIFGTKDDDEDWWAKWEANFDEPPAKREESAEEWEARMEAQLSADVDPDEDLSLSQEARRAICFRSDWESFWSPEYGAFEDTTRIPPMRFTFKKAPWDAMHENALQIFSAKVTTTKGSLPFDVFGMVAVRDTIDHNRNIVFCRTRDNCQTLTEEHPYLVLTGPTRAVLLELPLVFIEVELMVKGTTDSEDEKLSSLAVPISFSDKMYSYMWKRACTSKFSTVEFTLGHIISSVEATVFVRVTRGSWPNGFRGQFSAVASGARAKPSCTVYHTSVNDEEFILLDSGGEKVPVTGDGDIKLSRCVVSVDTTGLLKVHIKAWGGDNNVMETWKVFKPLDADISNSMLDIGFCKMDVTVAWSLILYNPVYANTRL
ncbi:unnamed protein product [Urochloa decumbens]|uniref:DUF6598 domain-containing protein n=1 Tax=Urochloa decumbens TaxID=240449 RepID=A0ABC9G111_9POAL